jgi:hypothetical protein
MPADRPGHDALLAVLAVAGVAACCGLPVFLTAAVRVTLAGIALGVWLAIVVGGVLVAFAAWRHLARSKCGRPPTGTAAEPSPH